MIITNHYAKTIHEHPSEIQKKKNILIFSLDNLSTVTEKQKLTNVLFVYRMM